VSYWVSYLTPSSCRPCILRGLRTILLVPPPLLLNMSRGGDQTGVARTAGVPNILFFPIFVMPNACSVAASTSSGRFRFRAIKSISDRYEPVPEGLIWGLILPVDRFDMIATTTGFGWLSLRLTAPTLSPSSVTCRNSDSIRSSRTLSGELLIIKRIPYLFWEIKSNCGIRSGP
jgi:hypothetical protein